MMHFDTPFELKFLAEAGTFEGYASVFGVTDDANDVVAPGAFRATLSEHERRGRLPPLLWQHDQSQPVGAWRRMEEDGRGLYVEGQLFVHDIPRAREAYKLLKEKVVTGLSIGYRARDAHRDEKSGARVLTEIDLLEVSMVTFPANDRARARLVKSALEGGEVPSQKSLEAFLREAGFSRGQAKGLLARGYKSLTGAPREAAGFGEDDTASAIRALAEKLHILSNT